MQDIKLQEEVTLSPIMQDVYRRLRTNIEFTGVDNRVICITSCTPSDGKSEVSYRLAKAFAEDGKPTLLIDADMRNSMLHNRLGYHHDLKGLSHYLAGKLNASDGIYKTNMENVFLMPMGVFPKNPTELLNKKRFQDLIRVSRKAFDYILIDTPPLGLVIDAAVIAKECDGSIMVISADRTSRRVAKSVKEQLKQANENLLGVVLNMVDAKNSPYGKKYGYGYGYGYGNTAKDAK